MPLQQVADPSGPECYDLRLPPEFFSCETRVARSAKTNNKEGWTAPVRLISTPFVKFIADRISQALQGDGLQQQKQLPGEREFDQIVAPRYVGMEIWLWIKEFVEDSS
ncbi:unnamed protein product, partial [Amoebophrya sp. A120]|eukprot:GSA120T00024419001.1